MTAVNKTHGKKRAHKQTVEQITEKRNPSNADGFSSSAWPCGTPKSTNNAFTGFSIYSTPLSDEQQYRSPLYSRWCSLLAYGVKPGPWESFRDAAKLPKLPHRSKHAHGYSVIKGLSKQAQDQLKNAPLSISIEKPKGKK
jgi:hypothetical protein